MKFIPKAYQDVELHPEGAREAGAALYLELEEIFKREVGFYPTSDQACQALAYALGDLLGVPSRLARRAELRAEMLEIIDKTAADGVKRMMLGDDRDG